MKLDEILKGVNVEVLKGDPRVSIEGISNDSRKVKDNYIFVAIEGYLEKGEDYIADAIRNGANTILGENINFEKEDGITFVNVKDARRALSKISSNFNEKPSENMSVVGVTGTNGKTTITYLVESILNEEFGSCGILGTIGYRSPKLHREAVRTTPEANDLHNLLSGMKEDGVRHVVMETSSHALYLKRLEDVQFDVAVFTNLTEEHLDFHKDMDNYFEAKRILFKLLDAGNKRRKCAILNQDDPNSEKLKEFISSDIITYGFNEGADFRISNEFVSQKGIKAKITWANGHLDFESDLIGLYNISNIACSVAISNFLGVNPENIVSGIKKLSMVPGRLERVKNDKQINVFVDYAHTPDALKNVVKVLSKTKKGKLITLFGCGGDRDKEKRPKMGEVTTSLSDLTVITTDNPRTEKPDKIISEILSGINPGISKINGTFKSFEDRKKYFTVIEDRKEAIRTAIKYANPGDTILIAGKGHETYQEIGRKRIHFDDREFVREVLS